LLRALSLKLWRKRPKLREGKQVAYSFIFEQQTGGKEKFIKEHAFIC
jgi:hypothetical protein